MTESREIIQEVKGGGPPGIRTQTVRILSPLPLPVGLEGHWWVGLDSNQRVSRRRFRSTGECHRPDSATYPFGGGCRNRTCVRFISVCRVSSAVPCHWANPPLNWRKRGDSNPYALSVRWFSGPGSHHLLISSALERRPRLELGKSGVAICRLVHFGIRRVVKELGGRGEGRTLMPEGAGS